jgi:hypothetical protein
MGTNGKPYIWLRYTTEFTTGGRTHTVEMGIPVPLGASAETREQLIREAEAGMDQLSRHVDNRVAQMLQRSTRPQSTTSPPASTATPSTGQVSQSTSRPSTPPVTSTPPPTATPSREGIQAQTPPPQEKREVVPPSRPPIGASILLNQSGDVTGNMKLSQFILFIRETWSLTPKQAMDLLNVKTLNGLNYREALKQLQPLVAQGAESATNTTTSTASTPTSANADNKPAETSASKTAEKPLPAASTAARTTSGSNTSATSQASSSAPVRSTSSVTSPDTITSRPAAPARPTSNPAPAPTSRATGSSPSTPATSTPSSPPSGEPNSSKVPIIPIHSGMVREVQNSYRFDEEEEDDLELDLEELEDFDNERSRAQAQEKLDKLKEAGGSTTANASRLTVLKNVIGNQVSETQLQRLIRDLWGATSVKKLKVDQAEALISWAKEDEFESEVEAVLALLEEEASYAGSDW